MSLYNKIPFATSTFVLKQTAPTLTDAESAVIDYFSPGFRHMKNVPKTDPDAQAAKMGIKPNYVADRQRRYAGDESLPRGCYYSLCANQIGDDRGTLIRELKAYSAHQKTGLVQIIDTTAANDISRAYSKMFSGRPAVVFIPVEGRAFPNPFADVFGLKRTKHTDLQYAMIPLTISQVSIPNVIDLRLPDTADWFAYHLTRLRFSDLGLPVSDDLDSNGLCFPLGPIDDFKTLLPSLLNSERGAQFGDVTQIAGAWLRTIGVSALVFPSARSNVQAAVYDGEISESYGWNLVDYRGAPPPISRFMISVNEWCTHPMRPSNTVMHGKHADPSVEYLGVRIEFDRNGEGNSLLKVSHYEEQQNALQMNATWAFFVSSMKNVLTEDDVSFLYQFPLSIAERRPQAKDLSFEQGGAINLGLPTFNKTVERIIRLDDEYGTAYYDTVVLNSCCNDLIASALQIDDALEELLKSCERLEKSIVAPMIPAVKRFVSFVLSNT